jgi:hypothetical protein
MDPAFVEPKNLLPSMCKALGPIPSTEEKKNKDKITTQNQYSPVDHLVGFPIPLFVTLLSLDSFVSCCWGVVIKMANTHVLFHKGSINLKFPRT